MATIQIYLKKSNRHLLAFRIEKITSANPIEDYIFKFILLSSNNENISSGHLHHIQHLEKLAKGRWCELVVLV
jgi:hypothetical protein